MKFHPIDNWLVIKARPQQEKVGSLALPGTDAANSFFPILGDVLEAGPGMRGADGNIFPNRIKKGDVVLLNNITARRLTVDLGNDVAILRETDIACVVTDVPAAPLTLVKES